MGREATGIDGGCDEERVILPTRLIIDCCFLYYFPVCVLPFLGAPFMKYSFHTLIALCTDIDPN